MDPYHSSRTTYKGNLSVASALQVHQQNDLHHTPMCKESGRVKTYVTTQ
jgi:hypothetical protein